MANEMSKGSAQVPQCSADVFSALRDEVDRMFERFERGLDDKDATVTLASGVLTMKGERKSERRIEIENH